MLQQPKIYTMMPLPIETVITSTDLARALRIAIDKARETGILWGIFVNLDHLGSFSGAGYVRDDVQCIRDDVQGIRDNAQIILDNAQIIRDDAQGVRDKVQGKVARNKIVTELTAQVKRLNRLACRDPLTGLYNYRYLYQRLNTEFKRAGRYKEPLSCVMLDVDDFKGINDSHGHLFGDSVLKKLAEFLRQNLRETDIITRYGGDEFCILLPHTDYQSAIAVMRKISERSDGLMALECTDNGEAINIGVSYGVASIPDNRIDQPQQLIDVADKSLYQAKTVKYNVNASVLMVNDQR